MEERDEYIHPDYPKDATTPWKENPYFNFVDRKNRAWGVHHPNEGYHENPGEPI